MRSGALLRGGARRAGGALSRPSSERVEAWRRRGRREEFRGRGIHVWHRPGASPTLLLLHGFPSSSFDWRGLLEHGTEHAALAFDFLGFGLSEKPRDHLYTLAWQAYLAEEMVRRRVHGPVFIVAHDMGTSVATELMARDLEGGLEMDLVGALLFNGSILIERAEPTPAQKVLRSPAGPLFSRLVSRRPFKRQFGRLFSPTHPLSEDEAEDQWALLQEGGGHRIGHRTIRYMKERETHADRWNGAFRDWPRPVSLAWGMLDPVAVPRVLEGLVELRPSAPVTRLDDLGHYPQVEAPERMAAIVREVSRASRERD